MGNINQKNDKLWGGHDLFEIPFGIFPLDNDMDASDFIVYCYLMMTAYPFDRCEAVSSKIDSELPLSLRTIKRSLKKLSDYNKIEKRIGRANKKNIKYFFKERTRQPSDRIFVPNDIYKELLVNRKISSNSFMMYIFILIEFQKKEESMITPVKSCHIKYEDFKDNLNISVPTAIKCIKELESKRLIKKISHKKKNMKPDSPYGTLYDVNSYMLANDLRAIL